MNTLRRGARSIIANGQIVHGRVNLMQAHML